MQNFLPILEKNFIFNHYVSLLGEIRKFKYPLRSNIKAKKGKLPT